MVQLGARVRVESPHVVSFAQLPRYARLTFLAVSAAMTLTVRGCCAEQGLWISSQQRPPVLYVPALAVEHLCQGRFMAGAVWGDKGVRSFGRSLCLPLTFAEYSCEGKRRPRCPWPFSCWTRSRTSC